MTRDKKTQALKHSFGTIYKQGQLLDNDRAKHLNLSGAQVRYIQIIGDQPGISQDAIAKAVGVDKGTVARAIKKLEVEQYVYRKRNKEDIRAWCIFLTRRGEEVYFAHEESGQDFEKKLFKGFEDEEIDTLVDLVGRLTSNLDKITKKG